MFPRYLSALTPFYDADTDGGGGGGTEDKDKKDGDDKGEDWKAKFETMQAERDDAHRRMTDADQQLRSAAQDAKLAKQLREAKAAGDHKKILELLELDPMLVGAEVLPEMFQQQDKQEPEEMPPWAKKIVENQDKQTAREHDRSEQEKHNGRMGQAYQFLNQEELGKEFPFLAILGPMAAQHMALRMQQAEEENGVEPLPQQIAKTLEGEQEKYVQGTIPLWAKHESTAKLMVEALREQKVITQQFSSFPTLTNKDQGGPRDKVDTSKMSDKDRLKFNLEQAKLRTTARDKMLDAV